MTEDSDLEELKEPIGGILLRNDIKCLHAEDGAYYHYSEVCKALYLAKSEERQELITKLKEKIEANKVRLEENALFFTKMQKLGFIAENHFIDQFITELENKEK